MTRTAFAWIAVVAAAAAGQALAQPAPSEPAPSEPAPAAAPPAAEAPPPAPPPAAAAPPSAAAPAAPPAPAPAAAPAPQAAIAPYIISVLDKVCVPLIHKQDAKAVIRENGLKRTRDGLLLVGPGVNRIVITPPDTANPTLCSLSLEYDIDQAPGIVAALDGWTAAQTPPLQAGDVGYKAAPGVQSWSWTANTASITEGLVFNARKSPAGQPLGKGYDEGAVLYTRRGG